MVDVSGQDPLQTKSYWYGAEDKKRPEQAGPAELSGGDFSKNLRLME